MKFHEHFSIEVGPPLSAPRNPRPTTVSLKHFRRMLRKRRKKRIHYYIGPHVYGMMYLDEATLHHVTVEGQRT